MRRGFCVLAVVVVALTWVAPADAAYSRARLLFELQDPEIDESSGLVTSSSQPRVLFTHNDSTDAPPFRFFAVGAQGQTHATYLVAGSFNGDWEDMARGPGSGGTTSLYFGDIGDNFRARPFLTVYEVKEPVVDTSTTGAVVLLTVSSVTHLVYPDGAHDAETLFVHPKTGALGIVTKDPTGASGVYIAGSPTLGIAPLQRVASISFASIARPQQPSDFDATSRLSSTGGDISPDGKHLVVRTYVEAFEWDIAKGIQAGLVKAPFRIPLPFTRQGEAIAYARDGKSVLTTSEQLPAPVHEIS